jgi:hypothetical protein
MKVPAMLSDAQLTETQGIDKFKVSLSFGSGGNVENVESFAWEAPWNAVIGPSNPAGTGGVITIAPPTTASHVLPTSSEIANKIGNDPANNVQSYETEAAALAGLASQGLIGFITDLPKHKAMAPNSYWNMVNVLWKSPARVHAKLTPHGDAPTVKVAFRANKTVDAGPDDGRHEFSALAHMVYDPATIGHSIDVTVNGAAQIHLKWPYMSVTATGLTWHEPGLFGGTDYHYDLEAWLAL